MKTRTFLGALLAITLTGCVQMSVFTPPPDWKTYPSEEFHLTLDCPYPLTLKSKETMRNNAVTGKWLTGQAALSDSLFMVNVASYLSKDPKMVLSSQLVVDNYLRSLDKTINRKLQYQLTKVQCSGRPATLLSGSYEYIYDPVHFANLIVTKPGQLVNVVVVYGDAQRYGAMAEKVIQSVKLDTKAK
jgi:hypothetical protein